MKTGLGFWSAIVISQVWGATEHWIAAAVWLAMACVLGAIEEVRSEAHPVPTEHKETVE